MRDLQSSISQLRCFEFEYPGNLTSKRRRETRVSSKPNAPRSSSRNSARTRPPSCHTVKSTISSSHQCIVIGDITQPKDSQNILVGSALRRPHATEFSPMDYQTMPDVGKAPKQPYRPKTACTVYGYASRPLSAVEMGNKHGKQTKSSLLRNKSASCDSLSSLSSSESLSQGRKPNNKKRLCQIREDYRPFKNKLQYKPITSNGESIHSFLTGARYNNTRYLDSRILSKLGVYIPKSGLKTFFVKEDNWIKQTSDEEEEDDDRNVLKMMAFIERSEDLHSSSNNKELENQVMENKAVNTDPHYLSIDRWHSADWHTERKPTSHKAPRAHTAPSRFKPINTFYYDYDTGQKYKYGTQNST